MKKHLFILLFLCLSVSLWAQKRDTVIYLMGAHPYSEEQNAAGVSNKYSHWSLVAHCGFNVFDGDFNSEMKHAVSLPSAGVAFEYSFTPEWSLGIEYMYDLYSVVGKPGAENADILLNGHMHNAGGYLALDLINLFFPRAQRKIVGIQPLICGGYSWYRNTIMYYDDSRYHTAKYEPVSMNNYKGMFYIGAGVNVEFNLNRTLALGARATYHYFVNDYPDGRGYSGPQALASKNNDGLIDVTLNLRIKFQARPQTHVRNIEDLQSWQKIEIESNCVHDTLIIKHDSIIVREVIKQMPREQKRIFYVYFDNNKSKIDDKGLITIQQVADVLAEDTTLYAVVTGYCDNTGSAALNYALGDKRAANVISELREEHQIDTTRMYAMGMGKLIGHRSQASYGPNRRAVIRIVDKNTFERMKSDLDEKRANRILEEDAKAPAAEPAQSSKSAQTSKSSQTSKPAQRSTVKTVPLEESAAPIKVNEYKQRASEEITVDKSTTLSKLARKYYNNTYCWVYIYIANKEKIKNPNTLIVGTKLTIPELTQEEMRITKDQSLVLYGNARQQK